MAYLQVDLTHVSRPVVKAFKQFPWMEMEVGGGVIILLATEASIFEALRAMQLEADCLDTTFEYPTTLVPVNPELVINGKKVREHFVEAGYGNFLPLKSGAAEGIRH